MTQEDLYQKIADTLDSINASVTALLQNMVPSSVQAEERAFVERAELDNRMSRADLEKKKLEVEQLQFQEVLSKLENK